MDVRVYWNVHKKCFSIQAKYALAQHSTNWGWRVGAYISNGDSVHLENAKFIVQPAGNKKVRETGHKNVHAYILGAMPDTYTTGSFNSNVYNDAKDVGYNPYVDTTFVDRVSLIPIYNAKYVILKNDNGRPIVTGYNVNYK